MRWLDNYLDSPRSAAQDLNVSFHFMLLIGSHSLAAKGGLIFLFVQARLGTGNVVQCFRSGGHIPSTAARWR